MRPKTNRLLMLLISAMLAGCASQTERSSSGGGAEQAQAPAPTPAPAPGYEPKGEGVQFVDRPLEKAPPPAQVAKAPKKPVSTYEVEPDEELGVLGGTADESGTLEDEEEGLAAMDSTAGEPDEELGVLGAQADESGIMEDAEEDLAAMDSTADESDEGAGDLGTQADESGTMEDAEEDLAAMDSTAGEPEEEADEPAQAADEPEEVADEPAQVAEKPVQVAEKPVQVAEKPVPVAEKPAQMAEKPVPRAPVRVSFEAEPLFSFDKSIIRSDQRSKLDEFVASLKGTQYDSIDVIGHADSIGSDEYNLDLSRRRANAVRTYLVRQGIPTGKINSEGRGESEPVTAGTCRAQRGTALIACLEPDRRVDVSVTAIKPAN